MSPEVFLERPYSEKVRLFGSGFALLRQHDAGFNAQQAVGVRTAMTWCAASWQQPWRA